MKNISAFFVLVSGLIFVLAFSVERLYFYGCQVTGSFHSCAAFNQNVDQVHWSILGSFMIFCTFILAQFCADMMGRNSHASMAKIH